MAVDWVSALLHECAKERHGVDLLGRDVVLLGRLLITLVRPSAPPEPLLAQSCCLVQQARDHWSPLFSESTRLCTDYSALPQPKRIEDALVYRVSLFKQQRHQWKPSRLLPPPWNCSGRQLCTHTHNPLSAEQPSLLPPRWASYHFTMATLDKAYSMC